MSPVFQHVCVAGGDGRSHALCDDASPPPRPVARGASSLCQGPQLRLCTDHPHHVPDPHHSVSLIVFSSLGNCG